MLVHLFDDASSPSCANYALKKTAEVDKNDFDSVTVETINVYVDDCLWPRVIDRANDSGTGLDVSPCILPANKPVWSKSGWLPNLEQFETPRCIKPQNFSEVQRSELHHFSFPFSEDNGGVSCIRETDVYKNNRFTLKEG